MQGKHPRRGSGAGQGGGKNPAPRGGGWSWRAPAGVKGTAGRRGAPRPPRQGEVDDSPCSPGHNTPLPLERSPPRPPPSAEDAWGGRGERPKSAVTVRSGGTDTTRAWPAGVAASACSAVT